MGPQLMLCLLYFPISVLTASLAGSTDYDYYDTNEAVPTLPAKQPRNKPAKKPKKPEVYPNIFEFYNTNEKIWVYNTTRKSNDTCMVDLIDETSLINVYIERFYFSDGTIKNFTIEAYFEVHPSISGSTSTYNEMLVRTPEPGAHYETLMFLGKKNDCGVFYMNYHGNELPGPHDWFELRLWNSSLENGPDVECANLFTAITRSHPRTFNYTPEYQCIFSSRKL